MAVDATPPLRIERVFPAAPARVFAAWTDCRMLAEWWGPEGVTCPSCEIDLRIGGRYRTCMRNSDGKENWVSGEYVAIEPNRRLAFTWAWENGGVRGHDMLVELAFEPAGSGTRLILTQSRFADADARGNHEMGWTSSFVRLGQHLNQ